ncbi:MAG TPA: hypothetical protein VMF53_16550 [Alphaproteobacteria bacterium]|nr:hypothetical protein [Alphaproteobacteria bacterium]
MQRYVKINRAPVLTLWAAVVAQRLGFAWDEALTLGRAVAGLDAHAKGVALGLFQPSPAKVRKLVGATGGRGLRVSLLHRAIPCRRTKQGLRALSGGRPIAPASVKRYLAAKFGADLAPARSAMARLARSRPPRALGPAAYGLYVKFRPSVPAGVKGWGARGRLDLKKIGRLSE